MLPDHEAYLHPKQPTKSTPQMNVWNLKILAFSQRTIPSPVTYGERKSWMCISKALLRDHSTLEGRSLPGREEERGTKGKGKFWKVLTNECGQLPYIRNSFMFSATAY